MDWGIRDSGKPNFELYFRAFFAYFDQTRCRWETEKDSCDDYVTDTDVTFSGDTDSETDSGTDSDADVEDSLDTDTNEVDETSSGDATDVTDTLDNDITGPDADAIIDADTHAETDVTNETTEKPFYQNLECEPLDETWMCSSGSKNHSLCIKFCTVGMDLSHDPVTWYIRLFK